MAEKPEQALYPRERVLAALSLRQPDRVPLFITFTPPGGRGFGRTAERLGGEYALCEDLECTLFASAWPLVGFEKLLADMLWLGDNVGTQRRLISPALWRQHLEERMRALIAAFKAQKPSVKIASRCCGSTHRSSPS